MSFRLKTIIGVAVIEAVLLLFLVWTGINYLRTTNEAELIKRASATLTLLARASRDAVLSTDIDTLDGIAYQAAKVPELEYVRILDESGRVLAEAGNQTSKDNTYNIDRTYDDVDDGIYDTALDITESDSKYGRIEIGLSTNHIDSSIKDAKQNASAIALLEMALVALFSLMLGTYLTRQLYSLTKATEKIANGDYGYQIDVKGSDELARTAAAFNRMSMQLEADREEHNAIFRSALDCIITIDDKGHIVDFNKAAESTFGYKQNDVIGKLMKDLIIPPSLRTAHTNGMSRYLETGKSDIMDKRIQVPAVRANGEEFHAELAITEVDVKGRKYFTAFMRDISERIKNETELKEAKESAEEADQAKTNFLASMSHEIRTPLNALLGFLGLLGEQNNLTGEQQTWIKTAQQSGESLLHLINETLDFSEIEAGRIRIDTHDFSLRELIDSTMNALAPKAKAKDITFTSNTSPDVPDYIHEDSSRLRQILINLLDNAIKYTDTGYIKLEVTAHEVNSSPVLKFTITDTGQGIPESEHDNVFTEFSRLPESSRMNPGTGLGLAITKRLVELLHGRISFKQREAGGTQFWFEIPLNRASDLEPKAPHLTASKHYRRAQKHRILLVDDSPANQLVAVSMLKESGCTIDTANNGIEALSAVQSLPYDLVLMDITMPEMDGIEATRAIRELPGSQCEIPIIAMTAHAIVGDREKMLDAGMNDYLSKPIMKESLYDILDKWLPTDYIHTMDNGLIEIADEPSGDILDPMVLEQLARDTSEEIVPKMLAAFSNETQVRLATLIQIFDDPGEAGQLQREAHTLKSSAATFGAIELQKIASEVESACRNNEPDEAREMLADLIRSAKETIAAVENYLNSTAGSNSQEQQQAHP